MNNNTTQQNFRTQFFEKDEDKQSIVNHIINNYTLSSMRHKHSDWSTMTTLFFERRTSCGPIGLKIYFCQFGYFDDFESEEEFLDYASEAENLQCLLHDVIKYWDVNETFQALFELGLC